MREEERKARRDEECSCTRYRTVRDNPSESIALDGAMYFCTRCCSIARSEVGMAFEMGWPHSDDVRSCRTLRTIVVEYGMPREESGRKSLGVCPLTPTNYTISLMTICYTLLGLGCNTVQSCTVHYCVCTEHTYHVGSTLELNGWASLKGADRSPLSLC